MAEAARAGREHGPEPSSETVEQARRAPATQRNTDIGASLKRPGECQG